MGNIVGWDGFWYWKDVPTILKEHRAAFIALLRSMPKSQKGDNGRRLTSSDIYEQAIEFHISFNEWKPRPSYAARIKKDVGIEARPEKYGSAFNDDMRALKDGNAAEAYGYLAWLWRYKPSVARSFYEKIGLEVSEDDQKELSHQLKALVSTNQSSAPSLPLSPPRRSSELYHFSHSHIELLGREKEQKKLRRFISDRPGFQWLQLAGVAGQGKSRIAWETIQEFSADCDAGFLRKDNLIKTLNSLDCWRPRRKTLIAIDYVNGITRETSKFLSILMANSEVYDLPVRVLLLERHSWNASVGMSSGRNKAGGADTRRLFQPDTYAPWFAELCNTLDGDDLNDPRFRFEDGVIELKELSSSNLVEIVRRTATSLGHQIKEDDAFIEKALQYIDQSGRPLFAYFLASCIADGSYQAGWSRTDLLTAIIRKDRRTRWHPSGTSGPDESGAYQRGLWLAVLATLTRGIGSHQIKEDQSVLECAARITDTPRDEFSEPAYIHGLEPDILGEWFILSCSPLGERLNHLLEAAWSLSAGDLVEFIIRLVQDFPEDSRTLPFIEYVPKDEVAQQVYEASSSLLTAHIGQNCNIYPRGLFEAERRRFRKKDGLAAFTLGMMHKEGVELKKDYQKVFKYWWLGSRFGNVYAMNGLALCYKDGMGVKKDPYLERYWYEKAASGGHRIAQSNLAVQLLEGKMGKRDPEKALQLLNKSAAQDHEEAMYNLGLYYSKGIGVEVDLALSQEWFYRAAKHKHGSAMYNIARRFHMGEYVDQDIDQAIKWYEAAAAVQVEDAMFNLGTIYSDNALSCHNVHKAIKWYEKAANAGHVGAKLNLSLLYSSASVDMHDPSLAAKWCLAAAESGNTKAMLHMGVKYEKGDGVAQSIPDAVLWYESAAAAGSTAAMVNLGTLSRDHTSEITSSLSGLEWLERAADLGNDGAMFSLATAYKEGWFEEPCHAKSLYWLNRAGDAGNARALYQLALNSISSGLERGETIENGARTREYLRACAVSMEFEDLLLFYRGSSLTAEPEAVLSGAYISELWTSTYDGKIIDAMLLGFHYSLGVGVKEDVYYAEWCFRKASGLSTDF
ncbi:MAG: tetratricopeptide repeat protein [Pseudomonadota bacterium]